MRNARLTHPSAVCGYTSNETKKGMALETTFRRIRCKMKAMASFQDLYVGLEPYRHNELLGGGVLKSTAPAVFGLLAAIELHPTNSKGGGRHWHAQTCEEFSIMKSDCGT
jgi:hypothetical protein